MNTKIIGSIIRWSAVVASTIGVFMGDASFAEALNRLKESISSGDTATIVGSAVTLLTLGWSIWDKIKTQKIEVKLKSEIASIKMLSSKTIEKKEEK